jgi:hypothetical protein
LQYLGQIDVIIVTAFGAALLGLIVTWVSRRWP